MRWVQRRDRAGRIDARSNQEEGLPERLGLSREEVDRAAWAVEATGRKFEGAAAINRVLHELGGVWAALGSPYVIPPVRRLEDVYYKRVARRRAWW